MLAKSMAKAHDGQDAMVQSSGTVPKSMSTALLLLFFQGIGLREAVPRWGASLQKNETSPETSSLRSPMFIGKAETIGDPVEFGDERTRGEHS